MNTTIRHAQKPTDPAEPVTVLIVEDSPVQTELLRRALESEGYRVIAAANGALGLVMAKECHPAAIVTDVNMPVMDGYAMCEAMRADASFDPTPIIVLTMLSSPQDLIRSLNAGADGYMTKPYDARTLVANVKSLLQERPTRQPLEERRKVEIRLDGQTYRVNADSQRMLDLLIATYQNSVLQNHALDEAQAALEDLNGHLEAKVQEQTAELRAHERRFRALIEHNAELVAMLDAQGLVTYISPSIKSMTGYDIAELMGTRFLDYVHPQDQPVGAKALNELVGSSLYYGASELRFRGKDGQWLMLDVLARNALGDPAVGGIVINARDISERKKAEEQIRQKMLQLDAAFMQTVEVVTRLSGIRDPYTSSHERRVADLAAAIGVVLGFDAQRQQGLRVAGLLHDVGKIGVPAEILAKPGRLSPVEYQLIQSHAQTGFDILKDVALPWPVAQVALQHHERINGSGYPQGLKGDAILLEARIVAVADVIEAMSSHRPYRPGLGIEAALLEIERGRASLYDDAVVDASLTLFRQQGYVIPE